MSLASSLEGKGKGGEWTSGRDPVLDRFQTSLHEWLDVLGLKDVLAELKMQRVPGKVWFESEMSKWSCGQGVKQGRSNASRVWKRGLHCVPYCWSAPEGLGCHCRVLEEWKR